ncbi:MAG TPA: AAA family ATPase [Dehalococcoidia bacterium]|nr:AAA family ATPase [Dehalococcoidia bacterium]
MAKTPEVLIVDQDLDARAEMSKSLRGAGFAIAGEAAYGMEAVATAREVSPDIVMVHVEEPSSRPLQTSEALANALPHTPLVVYSALTDAGSVRRAMLSGAKDYLALPVRSSELGKSLYIVLEQEERKRMRLSGEMGEVQGYATVLTVFGAKGGVGKTTLSVNLSTALIRETGQSVCLMDLDTSFGDVTTLLDMPFERTLSDAVKNVEFLNRGNIREFLTRHSNGLNVLPAPASPADWANITPQNVRQVIKLLAETHDYLIIDTPGAFNEVVAASLEAASLVLMVTSMDMASIKDTIVALDLLRSWSFPEEKLKIAVNHSSQANGVKPEDLSTALSREIFWQIPYDRAITATNQIGQPAVMSKPGARVSQSVTELARLLAGVRAGNSRGFMRRFLRV